MRSFTFRLETLLRLRKNARDRALAEYAMSIEKRELAESKVEEADLYLFKLNKNLSAKSQRLFLGNEMLAFQEQIKNAKILKDKFVRELSSLSSIESSRRNVFLQKEADFKSLDRYKERKAGEHLAYELKKEEKEQEDIISSRFVFNRAHP